MIRSGDILLFKRARGDLVSGILTCALKLKHPEYRQILAGLPFVPWHAAPVIDVIPDVAVTVMDARKEGNSPKEYKWKYIIDNCLIFRLTNNEPPESKVDEWVIYYTGTAYDIGAYFGTVLADILNLKMRLADNQYHCWEITCRFVKDILHLDVQPHYEYPIISKMLAFFIENTKLERLYYGNQ